MRNTIVYILVIGLILSSSYIEVFSVNSEINSEQEFFDYLDKVEIPRINRNDKVASYSTYKEYNLIVYGSPWGETKPNGIDGKTGPQQRYLGYTLENKDYTNPYFPPDYGGQDNKPENFNYIKPSNARKSWEKIHEDQEEHMLNSPLSGNGAASSSFTLNSIGGKDYGKLLSESTWKSQGSIYLEHRRSNGSIWYLTQTTPPIVGDAIVTGEISTPSETYYIRKDETQVKIPVTVTARAATPGRAKVTHIEEIKAISMGSGQTASRKATVSKTTDFIATRANYSPGTHTVTLNGSVSLKSVFNDTGSSNVSKTITLIVEEEGDEPYVTTTVTPSPREKKFEDRDVDVKLTVKGDLHNYTKASNIMEWVFYARHKEDTKNFITKKVYKKTLSASTDFEFKIPASRIVGDNFLQHYVVRSAVYFNEKVNGEDFYDSPAETFVRVYKEEAPLPPQEYLPPVAVIDSPYSVMAGEEIRISGIRSYAREKGVETSIVGYDFWTLGANGLTMGAYGDIWYPVENIGINHIDLTVTDSNGLRDKTTQRINVTEPTPTSNINISGTLKENRKIIIDGSSSYSPKHYPIVKGKSKITVTSLDGKTDDIYYHGSLDRTLDKEILIKEPGEYKVELYVENTAGYSDTSIKIFEVAPDIPPTAEYSMNTKAYRDEHDKNYATIVINDMSYSPDGDYIQDWIWTVTYNSNNSKDSEGYPRFNDNTSFSFRKSDIRMLEERTIRHGGISYRIQRTSLDGIEIKTNHVGYYLVELEVKEGFGQETIPDFINDRDYKRGNTGYKHNLEKVVKVDNHAPFADFMP